MIRNSLNLSNRIDQATIDLLQEISLVTTALGISYIVVGATARDLVLHHGYGAVIKRATADIDFGLQMRSWDEFKLLKSELIKRGFKATASENKMLSAQGMQVDIVPFGEIESNATNILWPPNGDVEMSVQGFKEAHDHAIQVLVQENPEIIIQVVSPAGLVLLKLISWADRDKTRRQRDAKDLVYVFENYEKITDVLERIYQQGIAEKYEYDITLSSANILGIDSASIAQSNTRKMIAGILKQNLSDSSPNLLVEEMCSNIDNDYQNKMKLLQSFAEGFGINA